MPQTDVNPYLGNLFAAADTSDPDAAELILGSAAVGDFSSTSFGDGGEAVAAAAEEEEEEESSLRRFRPAFRSCSSSSGLIPVANPILRMSIHRRRVRCEPFSYTLTAAAAGGDSPSAVAPQHISHMANRRQ